MINSEIVNKTILHYFINQFFLEIFIWFKKNRQEYKLSITLKKKKKTKKKNRFVCISVYRAYFHFFLLIHFNYFKLSNRKKRSLQLLLAIMKRKRKKTLAFQLSLRRNFQISMRLKFYFFSLLCALHHRCNFYRCVRSTSIAFAINFIVSCSHFAREHDLCSH